MPLPVLELSHLLGSAVGVGLMILANGLYRRLDAAWWLTIWLLCAGVLLSLLKGFDYEEATILAVVVVLLVSARGRVSPPRVADRAAFLGALDRGGVAGAWHVGVAGAVRLSPRSVRQGSVVAIRIRSLGAAQPARLAAGRRWSRPPTACGACCGRRSRRSPAPAQDDLEQAEVLIANGHDTNANLALLGDKHLMFNEERTAFIMYQAVGQQLGVHGRSGGTCGGCASRWPGTFSKCCDGMAVSPVFYQVAPENLSLYIDLGLTLTKLGEEARVPLRTLFAAGPGARRPAANASPRELATARNSRWCRASDVQAIMPELRAVSDCLAGREAGRREALFPGLFRRAISV